MPSRNHYDQELIGSGGGDCAVGMATAIVDRATENHMAPSMLGFDYSKVDRLMAVELLWPEACTLQVLAQAYRPTSSTIALNSSISSKLRYTLAKRM